MSEIHWIIMLTSSASHWSGTWSCSLCGCWEARNTEHLLPESVVWITPPPSSAQGPGEGIKSLFREIETQRSLNRLGQDQAHLDRKKSVSFEPPACPPGRMPQPEMLSSPLAQISTSCWCHPPNTLVAMGTKLLPPQPGSSGIWFYFHWPS